MLMFVNNLLPHKIFIFLIRFGFVQCASLDAPAL